MVGIEGKVWATTPLPEDLRADEFSIFAGVLPEDKFRLVKSLQKTRASGRNVRRRRE